MAVPRIPLYLNERFADFLLTGKEPYFNGKHVRVVCVDAFPDGSWPGVFTALERLPFAYRYHQRQILFHPDVSKNKYIQYEKAWKRAERKFSSKMMSTNGAADPDATEMKEEAKQAQAAATRGEFHFGTFNSKVILMHENLSTLDEQIKAVREKFHEVNYMTRLETNNMMDSWRGSWPGHAYSDCRVFPVHTKNFAHTMPKSTPYRGQKINTSPLLPPGTPALFRAVTSGQTPYDGQLHHKEAAHCLCVGPTRGGKSAALAFTAAQWMARFPDPQVFAFDKRGSLRILCEAMGGTYYLLKNPQLCPLGNLEDPEEQAWATWYTEYLCHLNRLKVTPAHRQAISKGIQALATWPDKSRSITNFCAAVRNDEIAQALEYYTVDSSSGGEIIDSDEDSLHLEEERFAVFEMEHILDKDPRILHAVLPYLFRLVRKRLHSAKQTLLPIDEAWMTKDPRFADVLRSWLTESAGRGGACFLSTQNLSDFISAENPLKDVVMNQCKNQLFIPNARASNDEQAPQYRNFDLNDAQILNISRGMEQREYFLKTPHGFSKIDFQLGAVALSFCGASSDVHKEQWARLYAQDPIGAPMAWLRHRNLPEWAAEYGKLWEKRQEEMYDAYA
jgi:type IV secretion system protein VirB4